MGSYNVPMFCASSFLHGLSRVDPPATIAPPCGSYVSLADFLSVMNESDELIAPELKTSKQRDQRYTKNLDEVAKARYAWTQSLSAEDQKIYF